MSLALKIAAGVAAMVFIVMGLAWLLAPSLVAAQLRMPLLAGDGLSTQIGDISAFFLTMGGSIAISLLTRRAVWLYPATMLLAFAATGRIIAWLVSGAGLPMDLIAVEAVVAALLFVLAQRMSAKEA